MGANDFKSMSKWEHRRLQRALKEFFSRAACEDGRRITIGRIHDTKLRTKRRAL